MICDKLMSGSKSTTPVSHNYLPATCAAPKTCSGCGATEGNVDPTKHTGNSIPATCTTDKLCESCGASVGGKNPSRHTEAPTYEILENNENHKNIYGCCGASTNETHSFPEGGACVCGAEPKVKVSKNDAEEEYYFTIAKVFSGLKNTTESEGAVVTLLSDLVMGDNDDITGGVFTIDLNGKSMTAAEDNNSAIYFNGYPHITIKDSGTNGSINGHVYCLVISNGTVIIEGGIFNCSSNEFDLIKAVRSELIIKGGTFNSSGDGVYAEPESTAVISGGVFNCASSDLWGYDGNISIVTDENGGPSFIGDLKTNTSIVSILDSDSFLYDSEGNLIALDETTEDIFTGVVVSKGADLTGATLTVNGEYVFIGKNITPTDVVVEFNGRTIDPENYTISYSDNLYVGTATLTITGVAPFTGSASTTFEIGKGTLRIVLPPEANHEFGDSYEGKTLTGGRVSIVGNNDAVVNGSWSWVGDGKWVTFMPDASYDGLFEELNSQIEATVYVSPASPVITLIAPSPSIMPGMSIQFKVEVKNPYDESLTELPRSFKIFYKTGESGTEVATDGLEFTLPTDVTIGESVYVYVENVAVDGMYHIARSQVIELTVGMIDYSEAIDNAVAELNVLIDTKADQATVEKAIERLENLVVNAEAAAKSYADEKDGELNTALTKAIGNAKTELTEAYTEAINNAKEALQELIDKKADQATLEKAIEDLNELIKKAEESAKTYSDEKDSQLNASLSSAITTARDELTRAYTKAIENAKKALEDKMKALDASLTSEIEALEKLLEKAQRDLETADEENREALEKATADAAKALAEANDKLERAIVNAEYRLGLKDKELERQTSKLTTALIVVGVVAGVALAGNTALITWVVVNRRKLTLNKKEDK